MSDKVSSADSDPGPLAPGLESVRSRLCAICHQDTHNYNLNYGGNSCLSCRAFFRRIVQQKAREKLKCKGKGGQQPCEIRPDNRKRCKRCRFEACLTSGMKPALVLDEGQFKKRFRKMLRKQKRGKNGEPEDHHGSVVIEEQTQEFKEESSPSTSQDFSHSCMEKTTTTIVQQPCTFNTDKTEVNEEDVAQFLKTLARVELPWESSNAYLDEPRASYCTLSVTDNPLDLTLVPEFPVLKLEDEQLREEINGKVKETLQREEYVRKLLGNEDMSISDRGYFEFVKRIREIYFTSIEKVRLKLDYGNYLLSLQAGKKQNCKIFAKTVFKSHIGQIEQFFQEFANQIDEFTSLSTSDQKKLLERNTRLFVQYVLARYLYAGSGYKQQQWLLMCQLPDYLFDSKYLRHIPLMTYNGVVQIFKDRHSIHLYEAFAKSVNGKAIPLNCNTSMAMVCLFSHDTNTALENPEKVKNSLDLVYNVLEWSEGKFNCGSKEDMADIMILLEKMVKTCDVIDSEDSSTNIHHLPLYVTIKTTEECFQDLLTKMNEIFEKVPFGEDLIQEYVMFNLGVPVSKHFFCNIMKVWDERYHALYYTFVNDPHNECNALKVRNIQRANSLSHLRHDSLKSGEDQMAHSLTPFDMDILNRKISQIKKKPGRIYFQDLSKVVGISESVMATYTRCQMEMEMYATCPLLLYKTLCLMTLFSDLPDDKFPAAFCEQRRKEYTNEMFSRYWPKFEQSNIEDYYEDFRCKSYVLSDVWHILFDFIKGFEL